MAPTSHVSTRCRVTLAAVLVLGAAVRLHDLGAQSAWADELARIVWSKGHEFDRQFGFVPSQTGARLPPRELAPALQVVSAHNPPLYGVLLNAWLRVAGSESDLVARLPSAALGVLSILGMFLAARRLLGARVGVVAAALVAFSPFHVFHAQEANHYALAACLAAVSLWFYVHWSERPRVASGVGLALTGLGALYTHYFAAVVLAVQAAELLLRHRREPRRLAIAALPYLAIVAGFAPYYRAVLRQLREMTHPATVGTFGGLAYFAERMQAIGVVPWLGERGEYLAPAAGVPIVALTVVLFAVGIRSVGDRATRRLLLINGVGPLAVVAVAFWATKGNSVLWSRYQLIFTFAQLIPIAAALDAGRRSRWLAAPALAVLAAVGFRFLFVDLVKEDWKGAVAAISSGGSRDDAIVVHRANLTYAVARYLPTENPLFGLEDGQSVPRLLDLASGGRDATWFVSAWAEPAAFPAKVHALLACRYARRDDFPVSPGRVGLTVTRYSEPHRSAAPPRVQAEGAPGCAPADPTSAQAWERASDGPIVEAAWVDPPAPLETSAGTTSVTVTGWAFSTRGIRSLRFAVDGRDALSTRHPGIPRPDVAAAFPAAPETHGLHAGYWAVVPLGSATPGIHSVVVTAVHEDGSTRPVGAREFTLPVAAGARP